MKVVELQKFTLEQLMAAFPDGYILYKDSGAWIIEDEAGETFDHDSRYNNSLKGYIVMFLHYLLQFDNLTAEGIKIDLATIHI